MEGSFGVPKAFTIKAFTIKAFTIKAFKTKMVKRSSLGAAG
jgi:hypothetical protein